MLRPPLLAVLLCSLLLAACGGDDADTSASGGTDAAATTATGPVSVTDDMGRQVRLDAPAKRVVVLEWGEAEDVLALGVQPVGLADLGEYRDYVAGGPAPAASVVELGTRSEPSLERIASLRPDLIINSASNISDNLDQFEKIAPTAVFDAFPEPDGSPKADTWAQMRTAQQRIGTLLGRRPQADALLGRLDREVATQRARLRQAGEAGDRVVVVQGYTDGKPEARLFDSASLMGELTTRLGLRDAFTGKPVQYGFTLTGLEGLRRVADADAMLTSSIPSDDPFTTTWAKNPAFRRLPVVARGGVQPIGGDTWVWGGPSTIALAARRIADATIEAG